MYTVHEGEIVVKEKYGSTTRERFYVRPPAQTNVVILDEDRHNDVASWFTRVFLPQGYPDSVSKDYLAYQIWDTAQAFCSTITGTLATREVLKGVGVGDTSATPLAATVTWVLKDGCGHIGKILFAFTHGTHLDAYSKKWRLYADTLNDAAMCIEIALPLFRSYTTFALCVSTVMKSVVGVAGGATRIAMTQHHAIRGNMADVAAKDSAQETAVNLIASIVALVIMTLFGNSLFIFTVMVILHIVFNYFAVRAVCLRTLNEPRFLQVINGYLVKEIISTPCEINHSEPIIFYQLGPNLLDFKLSGFKIKLGQSLKEVIGHMSKATHMRAILNIFKTRNYFLCPNIGTREMFIIIKDKATTDDILCAYFHGVLLSIITSAINDVPLTAYRNSINPRPFGQVCHTLQAADWSRESTDTVGFSGLLYDPSYDLMRYVDEIVQKEWVRVRSGLNQTGWDLSKHLIIVDEWRVSTKTLEAYRLSIEQQQSSNVLPFDDTLEEIKSFDNKRKDPFTIEPEQSETNISKVSSKNKSTQEISKEHKTIKESADKQD